MAHARSGDLERIGVKAKGEPDLASLLREHASRHSVPGAAIGILRDGTVSTAYTGVADTTTGEPVTFETRFAVGSLCKSMVATAVARLAEAGRLSLDDPIAAHVPELRGAGWAARARVRDLLANRSRLPLRAELEFSAPPGDDDAALSRLVDEVARGDPTPPFWSYSNVGWCVLGRALETLTGGTWEEAMHAELFGPLEMDQTAFVNASGAVPRASGHELTAEGVVRADPWTPRALAPAGATLLSTVPDLLRLAGSHLEDSSLAALRGSCEEIRIHGWLDAWCLGWARFDWDGGPVWGWDGLISGHRAVLRLVPEHDGVAVLLTNCGTGRELYRSIFPDIMEAWFGVHVPPLGLEPTDGAAGDLSRFTGVYAWPDLRWDVTAADTSLILESRGRKMEGLAIDDRTFLVDAGDPDTPTVTFAGFDDNGRPGVLYDMIWGLTRRET
jgi:CubicO group peptidase (beta-lactamase class C family)